MAECGEGVIFRNEADAAWTLTGEGAGGFGVPSIGEAFRDCYEDEKLTAYRVLLIPVDLEAKILAAIQDPADMANWLQAMRTHLGASRGSCMSWDEEFGAKNWDNYTALANLFAAMAGTKAHPL